MILPYFGEIDLNNLEEYYEVVMNFEHQKDFPLELWFDSEKISSNKIEPIICILNSLPSLTKKSNNFLVNEGKNVLDKYLNHQLSELSKSEKSNFGIFTDDDIQVSLQKIEEKIHIKSISIWPESEALLFDYTIGFQITDYVICIARDFKSNNWSIDIQS